MNRNPVQLRRTFDDGYEVNSSDVAAKTNMLLQSEWYERINASSIKRLNYTTHFRTIKFTANLTSWRICIEVYGFYVKTYWKSGVMVCVQKRTNTIISNMHIQIHIRVVIFDKYEVSPVLLPTI